MKHLGACDYSVKAFVLWTAQPRSRLPLCNHCRVFPRTPASSASECAVPDPRIYTGPRVQAKTANVQTHAEHTRAGGLVCFLSHRQLRSFSPSHTRTHKYHTCEILQIGSVIIPGVKRLQVAVLSLRLKRFTEWHGVVITATTSILWTLNVPVYHSLASMCAPGLKAAPFPWTSYPFSF